MNTNTAQTDLIPFQPRTEIGLAPQSFPFTLLPFLALLFLPLSAAVALPAIGPWVPIFPGSRSPAANRNWPCTAELSFHATPVSRSAVPALICCGRFAGNRPLGSHL